jgi:2-hydroxychromene-2-carboxylate isomerase
MLDFWFDFASTYSYPTAMRLEALGQRAGVAIRWRPFLLGPIFNAQGWSDSPFNVYPVKGRYMWRDMARVCAAQQLAFTRPSAFPRNGLLAARLACWFDGEPWQPEWVRRVFAANFAANQDIADPQVLAALLQGMGLPSTLLAEATTAEAKLKLRLQTERAQSLGLFGAPSFCVGDELFWGNDRLEAALAWAVAHAPQG